MPFHVPDRAHPAGPPPLLAELPENVLLLMVTVPPIAMPPPMFDAELPENVLLLTDSVPLG